MLLTTRTLKVIYIIEFELITNRPFPSYLKPLFQSSTIHMKKHNHSYENEFNLHMNEISFSYERMSTKTRFEKEAQGNSEMAYS